MEKLTNIKEVEDITQIPPEMSLKNILLPCEWVVYLYDKQLFKKMANKPNFQAKPYKEIFKITNVNDMFYFLHLMAVSNPQKNGNVTINKLNLDCNDYIIMRKGIEPIWEDPKNSNGGLYSIRINHDNGFNLWSNLIFYLLGETLTDEYEAKNKVSNEIRFINGMTVSFITDSYNNNTNNINNYTLIKIWDGKENRNREMFTNILPVRIRELISDPATSIVYSQNNSKKDFGEKNIMDKIFRNNGSRGNGGFKNSRGRGRRH